MAERIIGVIANLDRFLDVVQGMSEGPLDHFTCTEVEALADLMTAQRGDADGIWVIIHHLNSEDEEHDELAAHLEKWEGLRELLPRVFSPGVEILETLRELEEEGR